jgi:hypothetical protein
MAEENAYYRSLPRLTPYSVIMLVIFVLAGLLTVYLALWRAPWDAENNWRLPVAFESRFQPISTTDDDEGQLDESTLPVEDF